jgi:hypothetical protein
MQVNQQFDCTQRELVIDIARTIYKMHGCNLPQDQLYLWRSQHPLEQGILSVSEAIFEMFYGDSPDYSDDPEELQNKIRSES